jgi:hypothetical protein
MVCHFCYNGTGNDHKINGGTDNGVTIQAYTDQDTACHFCYGPAEGWHYHSSQDGSKYGMLVLLKRGMLFLLERNRGMTTIQARTDKSMVCHCCYGEAKNGTATYSRTENGIATHAGTSQEMVLSSAVTDQDMVLPSIILRLSCYL